MCKNQIIPLLIASIFKFRWMCQATLLHSTYQHHIKRVVCLNRGIAPVKNPCLFPIAVQCVLAFVTSFAFNKAIKHAFNIPLRPNVIH